MAWLDENESHRNSDLGLFIRAGLEFGLDKFGQGAWQIYCLRHIICIKTNTIILLLKEGTMH